MNIADAARAAGFQGDDLVTAVAIAYAESGGDPNNYNPETAAGTPQGLGSYGLWQVYLKAHPEFSGWDLFDPATNARAAYAVYRQAGNSFSPWSTFQHGSYQAFLGQAVKDVASSTKRGATVLTVGALILGGALLWVLT